MVYVVQNSQNFSGLFHRHVFQKTRRFGNWICFRSQVKVGEKTPTQLAFIVILFLSLTGEIGCRVFIRCFPRTGVCPVIEISSL
jgi:hypothetical protein